MSVINKWRLLSALGLAAPIALINAANLQSQKIQITLFDAQTKAIVSKDLLSDKIIWQIPFKPEIHLSPTLVFSNNNQTISASSYDREWLLNTKTRELTAYTNQHGTIITAYGRFYLKRTTQKAYDELIFESAADKEIIGTYRHNMGPPQPMQLEGDQFSLFFRSEQQLLLLSADGKNTEKISTQSVECLSAIWLARTQKVLCILGNNKAIMLNRKGEKTQDLKGFEHTDSIKGYDDKTGSVVLSRMALKWQWSWRVPFQEVHDIYLFDENTHQITLIKKAAVGHGERYAITFD